MLKTLTIAACAAIAIAALDTAPAHAFKGGISMNGIGFNGMHSNGAGFQGIRVNGLGLNSSGLNGRNAALNGQVVGIELPAPAAAAR